MSLMATTIITGDTLAKLLIGAFIAGVGVTTAFSLLIYCTDRAAALRRQARPASAGVYQAASALALTVCLAIVAYGLVLMTNKPK